MTLTQVQDINWFNTFNYADMRVKMFIFKAVEGLDATNRLGQPYLLNRLQILRRQRPDAVESSYAFLRPDLRPTESGAIAEAKIYVKVVTDQNIPVSHVLWGDLERGRGEDGTRILSWATITGWKNIWLNTVKAGLPKHKVGLYVNRSYWYGIDAAAGDGLWIADPSHPAGAPAIKAPWVLHQYAETGGIDRDVYNGDYNQLLAWAGRKPVSTPPVSFSPISIRVQPTAFFVQVPDDVSTYVVTASGTRHLRNDAERWFLVHAGVVPTATPVKITKAELRALMEVE